MIGNRLDAHAALMAFRSWDRTNVLSPGGTTRMVYLINGIVYKVENAEGINECEYENINHYSDQLPEGIAFPEVSMFHVLGENIIAMQYIQGQPMARCYCFGTEVCGIDCAPEAVCDFMDSLGLDSGGMNIILSDGTYYIIDAG